MAPLDISFRINPVLLEEEGPFGMSLGEVSSDFSHIIDSFSSIDRHIYLRVLAGGDKDNG